MWQMLLSSVKLKEKQVFLRDFVWGTIPIFEENNYLYFVFIRRLRN